MKFISCIGVLVFSFFTLGCAYRPPMGSSDPYWQWREAERWRWEQRRQHRRVMKELREINRYRRIKKNRF
jgi:hypothetical protein